MKKVLYILGQLDDDDIEWMIDNGVVQSIAKGSHVVQEGGQIDAFYVVLDGLFSVSMTALGKEITRLAQGEIIGEMSFVDTRPPSATVTALQNSHVLAIPHDDLSLKLEDDPFFASRFYKALAIFLSYRLRKAPNWLGFGKGGNFEIEEDETYDDELDLNVLDNIHLAGMRFDRMVKRLL